jgi:uncharacterized protein YraI
MFYRALCAAGALACAVAVSTPAAAAPGTVIGNVNMRTGPGTQFNVVTTIPAGAPIEVFGCQRWCHVAFAGRQGYVAGNYVSTAYARYQPAPRVYVQPAPRVYYDRRSRWDDDYYYSDRPYRSHRGYRPYGGGIYFQFGN